MDFGDILALLIYIAIPVFISSKKKARKAQREEQRRRSPLQQPVQGKTQSRTQGGGLMGRLESMMKELEKAAESGKSAGGSKPSGAPKPATKPVGPITHVEVYKAPGKVSATAGTPDRGRGARPGGIPVWRVADDTGGIEASAKPRAKEKPVVQKVPVAVAGQSSLALFGKDDLVKGIILSEILQPPVSLRQRNKRRPF